MDRPVRVRPRGPIAAAGVVFRRGADVAGCSSIAKVTFSMIHGGFCRVKEPRWIGAESALGPLEFVPRLGQVEVLLSGYAIAVGRRPVQSMATRLVVWREGPIVDRTLHIYGPPAGGGRAFFSSMPLIAELSPRGADESNPEGITNPRFASIFDPLALEEPATFGPYAWPRHVSTAIAAEAAATGICHWPADVHESAFNRAPMDQRTTEWTGDEWIAVDGVHAEFPRFATRLPNPHVRTVWLSARGVEGSIAMRLETILIDAAKLEVSLIWRGQHVFGPSVPQGITLESVLSFDPADDGPVPTEGRRTDAPRPAFVLGRPPPTEPPNVPTSQRPRGLPFGVPLSAAAPDFPGSSRVSERPLPVAEPGRVAPVTLVPPPDELGLSGGPSDRLELPFSSRAPAFAPAPFAATGPSSVGPQPYSWVPRAHAPAETSNEAHSTESRPPAGDAIRETLPPETLTASTAHTGAPSVPPQKGAPATRDEAEFARELSLPVSSMTTGAQPSPIASGASSIVDQVVRRVSEGLALHDLPLAGVDLSGLNLEGANLSRANLSGTKLIGANLRRARLNGARLISAELSDADGTECDLTGADLSRARLSGTILLRADLSESLFVGATLLRVRLAFARAPRALFSRATLEGVDATELSAKGADFSHAVLRDVDLSRADLTTARLSDVVGVGLTLADVQADDTHWSGASLSGCSAPSMSAVRSHWDGATLVDTCLDGGDFTHASFSKVKLQGGSARDAELSGTTWTSAQCEGASLDKSRLDGSDFRQSKWQSASFVEADLSGLNAMRASLTDSRFDGAILCGASFRMAKCRGASFRGAKVGDTDFRDAELDGADLTEVDRSALKLAGARGLRDS